MSLAAKAGRKNRTPLCRERRRAERERDRDEESDPAPKMEAMPSRTLLKTENPELLAPKSTVETSDGAGDEERMPMESGNKATSSSLVEEVGLVGVADGVTRPGKEMKPMSRCHLPFRSFHRGRRTSYAPPILLRPLYLLFLLDNKNIRRTPTTRIARPIHIKILPHLPRNPMKAASSACQLLP